MRSDSSRERQNANVLKIFESTMKKGSLNKEKMKALKHDPSRNKTIYNSVEAPRNQKDRTVLPNV